MTTLVNFNLKTFTHTKICLYTFKFFFPGLVTRTNPRYKPLWTCKYTLTWIYGTTNTNAPEVPCRTVGIKHPHYNQKPGVPHPRFRCKYDIRDSTFLHGYPHTYTTQGTNHYGIANIHSYGSQGQLIPKPQRSHPELQAYHTHVRIKNREYLTRDLRRYYP